MNPGRRLPRAHRALGDQLVQVPADGGRGKTQPRREVDSGQRGIGQQQVDDGLPGPALGPVDHPGCPDERTPERRRSVAVASGGDRAGPLGHRRCFHNTSVTFFPPKIKDARVDRRMAPDTRLED